MGRRRVHRTWGGPMVAGALVLALAGVGAGLYWFQPWKLWQDETVEEALPGIAAEAPAGAAQRTPSGDGAPAENGAPAEAGASREDPAAQASPEAPAAPAGPVTLSGGELISHEHATSGTVKLVRLEDGTHVVRLENLDTSNGPDLRVWLTDAPVMEGRAGWHVFDDGKYVSLGKLKGNKGSQNYALPTDVDPAGYTSVSIWCDRFDVSFGAAELARA
ncbi:DM13 domain-containing protein [Streptomyces sp. TRM68367]|uniref:DM13 domain-containing protein n=1 Tax=Streptomyces sp. TRM68367 TaxID=2758415 RepID=UPI00165AD098|nr:DM13 domain-containing protein [Streptomyces sp. TRM68367]MBC9726255.1 DM13 domain-containing protein [Streptomyces sp. TRM68367]